jgi:Rod binding domain-containing protein
MNVLGSPSLADPTADLSTTDKKPTRLGEAAKQFESLMIGELLKSAGGDGSAWLGDDADTASETAMGMAQTQFAQVMASKGGFGLAKTIERAMTRPAPVSPDAVGK